MKRYEFHITIAGYGDNPDQAWEDATEQFAQEPGATPESDEYEITEE